ncbi:hypothetical protein D3C87_1611920 [compost metagenome]
MALTASRLPGMEQPERVEALVEQGQRVVRCALNQFFGQLHLTGAAATHHSLGEQMAGQLHLAKHAHLRISRLALLGLGFGEGGRVFGGVGGTPHHAIDGQQL